MLKRIGGCILFALLLSQGAAAMSPNPAGDILSGALYVESIGQLPPRVRYAADVDGGRVLVTAEGLVFQTVEMPQGTGDGNDSPWRRPGGYGTPRKGKVTNATLRFEGGSMADVAVDVPSAVRFHRFLGADPSRWHSDIPAAEAVRVRGLYPGIDLVLDGTARHGAGWYLEARDGSADVEAVRVRWEAGDAVASSGGGYLLRCGGTEIHLPHPVWVVDGRKAGRVRLGEGTSKLEPEATGRIVEDRGIALPLDILWGTYFGGSGVESDFDLAFDDAGNAYLSGTTFSDDLPVPNGYDQDYNLSGDIFVAKITAAGDALEWATFLGGSGYEEASCRVRSDGNIALFGHTDSTDIPTPYGYDSDYNGGIADFYLAELSGSGSALHWGTYLGGSGADGLNYRGCLDAEGHVVLAGEISSDDIPVPGGFDQVKDFGTQCLYVAKFHGDGSGIAWGTYLEGSDVDFLGGIALDASGGVVLSGATRSPDIPTPGGYDRVLDSDMAIYAAKLSAAGDALLWGTYIEGSSQDQATGVDVDGAGDVVVTGFTFSTDIPTPGGFDQSYNGGGCTQPGWRPDGYVAKLRSLGDELLWGTYIGGECDDIVYSGGLTGAGEVILGGETDSVGMPTTPDAWDGSLNGTTDGFLGFLSADGSQLIWGSYWGGTGNDLVTVHRAEGAWLLLDRTDSTDLPTAGGVNPTPGDVHLAKVVPPYDCELTVTSPNGGETLYKTEDHAITWTKRGGHCASQVTIELYHDGAFLQTIAAAAVNTGSYDWSGLDAIPSGQGYQIRIADLQEDLFWDRSDGYFAIRHPDEAGFFEEDFESGAGDWVAPEEWHLTTGCSAGTGLHSLPTTFYFGAEAVPPRRGELACNYDTGQQILGCLTSPAIDLEEAVDDITLEFAYYLETERAFGVDRATVTVWANSQPTVVAEDMSNGGDLADYGEWRFAVVDISSYAGKEVMVEFCFDSVDGENNDFEGWHVDDVAIFGEEAFPCTLDCSASAEPSSGPAPLGVQFTGAALPTNCEGDPVYAWEFGDGETSAEQSPLHEYDTPGQYYWIFTVTMDGKSCMRSGWITVRPCILACSASADPVSGVAPVTVHFTGQATATDCPEPPEFLWSFGDGDTSNLQNPSHVYIDPGVYDWSLTVATGGETCQESGTIDVEAPCEVTCGASAAPSQGSAPLEVTFDGQADSPNCPGDPATFVWQFGDGDTSELQHATHVYDSPGSYGWTMTATIGGVSCVDAGYVQVDLPCQISCSGSANPTSGDVPLQVSFAAVGAAVNCPDPLAYHWDFGDGSSSGDQNADHVFDEPGTYTWTLTVSSGESQCTDSGTIEVLGFDLPGDCDHSGTVSIGEVQGAINMFLGAAIGCGVDTNEDGAVSIGEIQAVINAFLGKSVT